MAYTAEKAFDLIESAHRRGRLAHAFLITGEAGCGKTELAARIIQLVNPPADAGGGENLFGEAEEPEPKTLDELEGELVRVIRPTGKARQIKIENMRRLEKSFHVAAAPDVWKVGVVVHADRLNAASENAFLKTLEEPPRNCLLLLLSDSPEQLLPTVLSRCVRLPLMAGVGQRLAGEDEKKLLAALASLTRQGLGSTQTALSLRAAFSDILASRRAAIVKSYEEVFKEESKKYKNTTDSDTWLKERETHHSAQAESDYLNEREKLIEVLISWMGDVVRQKCGVQRLDFPGESKVTASVAAAHDLRDLLRRMDGMEDLRAHFGTNVQEQLAMEVAFLTVFA